MLEKPFERAKQKWKRLFFTAGICKCTVILKLKIYNLQMFSRTLDVKCFFVSSNFVLFRNIRTAEVYSEPSRTYTMELFEKIVKRLSAVNYFHKKLHLIYLTGLWIRLWIASTSEYSASLNLSSLCYCINKGNS